MPRLLLAWLCTEADRTRSRELVLGDSFAAFMRKLAIHNDDGRTRRRLQEQMRRLFGCMVSLTYKRRDVRPVRPSSRIAGSTGGT